MATHLRTERLILREFEGSDFEAVHAYGSDPDVVRFMSWGPNREDDTREFLSRVAREASAHPRANFDLAVVRRSDATLLGGVGLIVRRLQYREYELGYCFAKPAWGQGFATESCRAMLDLGFGRIGAHRIFATVDPRNDGSKRVLGKLGFRQEGHQHRDTLVNGEWCDSLVFALLAEEHET
jgi:ribosomal-protein-alanine N-acetyltransferase